MISAQQQFGRRQPGGSSGRSERPAFRKPRHEAGKTFSTPAPSLCPSSLSAHHGECCRYKAVRHSRSVSIRVRKWVEEGEKNSRATWRNDSGSAFRRENASIANVSSEVSLLAGSLARMFASNMERYSFSERLLLSNCNSSNSDIVFFLRLAANIGHINGRLREHELVTLLGKWLTSTLALAQVILEGCVTGSRCFPTCGNGTTNLLYLTARCSLTTPSLIRSGCFGSAGVVCQQGEGSSWRRCHGPECYMKHV